MARQFAGNFEAWLRRKVIEEAGYDRIVREILTAKLDGRNTDLDGGRELDPSPAALLPGQGAQAREPRRRRGARLPGDSPGMRPVPQSPVRRVEAGAVLEPRRLLRRRAARRARGRASIARAIAMRPAAGADDSGDQEGRQGVAPRRLDAGMAAPRRDSRDSGRVGHLAREPVFRPGRRQPRLGSLLRRRPDRAGR